MQIHPVYFFLKHLKSAEVWGRVVDFGGQLIVTTPYSHSFSRFDSGEQNQSAFLCTCFYEHVQFAHTKNVGGNAGNLKSWNIAQKKKVKGGCKRWGYRLGKTGEHDGKLHKSWQNMKHMT